MSWLSSRSGQTRSAQLTLSSAWLGAAHAQLTLIQLRAAQLTLTLIQLSAAHVQLTLIQLNAAQLTLTQFGAAQLKKNGFWAYLRAKL